MLQAEFDKLTRDNLEHLKFVLDANGDVAIRVLGVGGGGGGTTVFTGLTDTPANYTGGALKSVRVNALGTGLEYGFTVNKDVPANALFTDTTYTVGNGGLTQINYTTTKDTLLGTAEQTVNKNALNGYAGLDGTGKLLSSQLPALAITTTYVVASQVAQLALTVQEGDVAVRSDLNQSFIALNSINGAMTDWQQLLTPVDTVLSVAGKTGVVVLVKGDVGLGNVDNTTDLAKPISTATQTALDGKQIAGTYASGTGSANGVNTGDNAPNSQYSGLATSKEDTLGNPTTDGDVLSSTIAGVRSWITPSVGTIKSTAGTPLGSLQINEIVSLTLAQYNAGAKVATTLYIII